MWEENVGIGLVCDWDDRRDARREEKGRERSHDRCDVIVRRYACYYRNSLIYHIFIRCDSALISS